MNDRNYDYKFFEFLGNRINQNNDKLQELLKDENVRKFVNILEENRRLSLGIKNVMEECSHVFVMTEVCEEGNVVYHCLKCGLTNEYDVKKQDKILTEYEIGMSDVFKRTFAKGTIIGDRFLDLSIARKVYDFIKREYPSCSQAELEEMFFFSYVKMTETKSAAEQWYEAEERSLEIAIDTLNRIAENNKRKIK